MKTATYSRSDIDRSRTLLRVVISILLGSLAIWASGAAWAQEEQEQEEQQAKQPKKGHEISQQLTRVEQFSTSQTAKARALPARDVERRPAFRWHGESLYFSIRINGAEAMRASVRAGDIRHKGNRPYVPISGNARSVGFFQSVYPMHDQADSYLDPYDLRPHRSEKLFEERSKSRTYEVDYTHEQFTARVVKSKPKRTIKFHYAIPGETHDMLSWAYDLRTREMEKGEKFVYFVYDGWKLSKVHLEVLGKQETYTPMGWFKTWELSFVREVVRSRPQKKNGEAAPPHLRTHEPKEHSGKFYLSRDENLLPVKLTMKTKFGLCEALLIKYAPADDE